MFKSLQTASLKARFFALCLDWNRQSFIRKANYYVQVSTVGDSARFKNKLMGVMVYF